MNNIFIVAFFSSLTMIMGVNDRPRNISKHEMVQPIKDESIDPLKRDTIIEKNKQLKRAKTKETLQEQGSFLLNQEDAPDCRCETAQIEYYYSKDLLNVSRIVKIFYCAKEEYSVAIDYKIYSKPEYAKKDVRMVLSHSAGVFYEDQIDRSFTGSQYGDFCVNIGVANNMPGLVLLYKNYFIRFDISHKIDKKIDPALVDIWADKIVKKIKAGYGENIEPASP